MSAERKVGKPRLYADVLKTVTVRLSEEEIAWARFIGHGNLAAGVRKALSLNQAPGPVSPTSPDASQPGSVPPAS